MLMRRAVLAAAIVVATGTSVFGMASAAQAQPPGEFFGIYSSDAACEADGQSGIADHEWTRYACTLYGVAAPKRSLWVVRG